jgi:hypothetical protein
MQKRRIDWQERKVTGFETHGGELNLLDKNSAGVAREREGALVSHLIRVYIQMKLRTLADVAAVLSMVSFEALANKLRLIFGHSCSMYSKLQQHSWVLRGGLEKRLKKFP